MELSLDNFSIVILAAGSSSRLGSPKQELVYKGKTLLQNAVDTALATKCKNVLVVLGANLNLLKNQFAQPSIQILENKHWQQGMSSSIRYALQNITEAGFHSEYVIFMVCDQPYVTSSLLLSLLHKSLETGLPIIASAYGNSNGTPALFHKSMYPQLLQLTGDKGARSLLVTEQEKVGLVTFEKGDVDIDTVEDYELLKRQDDC